VLRIYCFPKSKDHLPGLIDAINNCNRCTDSEKYYAFGFPQYHSAHWREEDINSAAIIFKHINEQHSSLKIDQMYLKESKYLIPYPLFIM
jgi:hypothetical protein